MRKTRFLITIFFCLTLLSCKAPSVIPSSSHNENNTQIIEKVETLYVKDSVIVEKNVYLKGDTVYVEREVTRWRDRFRDRWHTDTTTVVVNDTLRVEVPVEKVVTVVPKFLWWSLGLNLAVICFCVWRIWRRARDVANR